MKKNDVYASPGRGPSPAEKEGPDHGCEVCGNHGAEYCDKHNFQYCEDCGCPECQDEYADMMEAKREDHDDFRRDA